MSRLKLRLQPFFPELKESEDEKVRKALVELVKCNERSGYTLLNNVSTSSMFDWLERQGEQKPIETTWKPSDEQMEVLLSEVTGWKKGCPKQIVLESLYNDLKKLKGE